MMVGLGSTLLSLVLRPAQARSFMIGLTRRSALSNLARWIGKEFSQVLDGVTRAVLPQRFQILQPKSRVRHYRRRKRKGLWSAMISTIVANSGLLKKPKLCRNPLWNSWTC